jgi:curli biogenesis system outer membrane secretion channel CsgG
MNRLRRWLLAGLLWVAWIQTAGAAGGTVVIWDFDNNTVGPMHTIQAAEPLSRLLPEVLLAHLSKLPDVTVVERVRLREILEELKLGTSQLSSEETRLRLGKILGARNMVFGEFVLLAGMVRADIRLVEVETGRILISEPIFGTEQSIIDGTQVSAENLARQIAPTQGQSGPVTHFPADAWSLYNQGLVLMDRKSFDAAADSFHQLLKRHPGFSPAQRQLMLALERAARN